MQIHETLLCTPEQIDLLPELAAPLLAWYRSNARPLPWRDSPTPYHVWISEIMLQQTRVEAVKGYYTRFLHALPTVSDLASAPESVLLKLWEGLGYYSRARNLHRAAKLVVEKHGGELPADYAALRALPGIGEYTAGAIASIAFGLPVPAVDGNVYRVIARILGSYADISRPPVKAAFREAVFPMIPPGNAGDFTQALMELGATVCLPNGPPLCAGCPVAASCAAQSGGFATDLPVKSKLKARRTEQRTIILVLSRRGVLLFRRGETGLLAGLSEPLNCDGRLSAEQAADAVRALGGEPQPPIPLRAAKHIFSHVEWHMDGYLIYCLPFDADGAYWADRAALQNEYAIPAAFSAFFREIGRYLDGLPQRLQ